MLVIVSVNVINHVSDCKCKCRKTIIDKLVEECGGNIYENETLDAIPLNFYKKVCNSCMVYIVLFAVFLITSICICCFYLFLLVFKKR